MTNLWSQQAWQTQSLGGRSRGPPLCTLHSLSVCVLAPRCTTGCQRTTHPFPSPRTAAPGTSSLWHTITNVNKQWYHKLGLPYIHLIRRLGGPAYNTYPLTGSFFSLTINNRPLGKQVERSDRDIIVVYVIDLVQLWYDCGEAWCRLLHQS